MAQIETWLLNQFRYLPQFMNLDNTEQVDVWPFFTSSKDVRRNPNISILRRSATQDLSSALEICGSSPSCHQASHGIEFNLSNQATVLCYLMPHLKYRWLRRPGLVQYAMTTERYALALRQTAFYILQLPKHDLVAILKKRDLRMEFLATPIMRMISDVFVDFLTESPPATDLYFLLVLIEPLMAQCLVIDPDSRISAYAQKVSILLSALTLIQCSSSAPVLCAWC